MAGALLCGHSRLGVLFTRPAAATARRVACCGWCPSGYVRSLCGRRSFQIHYVVGADLLDETTLRCGADGGEEAMTTLKRKALAVVGVALTIFMYTKIGLLISAFLLVVVVIATAGGRPKDEQRRGL